MEEITKPLTVAEFAEIICVPVSAVIKAIESQRIIPIEVGIDPSLCTIHPVYIDKFEIELITVTEYIERRGVSKQAVYQKIDNGKIDYFLDDLTNKIMIDWIASKDVPFRAVNYKRLARNSA